MAVLHIYNDIQTESQKNDARFWGETEGICFKDVKDFIKGIPTDDNNIDLYLHCDGGSCTEGWAMYDALRATGKEITATVEGDCASMATVVYMAAPKERRKCMPSAHICVHNPWMPSWGLDYAVNADDLQKAADDLRAEQERMVNLYVERCGCDKDEIQALMDEDKFIDAQKALELGIVGEVLSPLSASKKPAAQGGKSNKPNINNMAKDNEKVEVKASFWEKVKAFFKADNEEGIEAAIEKGAQMNALKLTSDDGTEITIDRESGAPEVGDTASPDGTFEMPDDSTIVIENGVITSITPDSEGSAGANDFEGKKGDGNAGPVGEKDKEINALKAQAAKDADKIKDLEARLEKAEKLARTKDDLRILNAVKMAGGEAILAKISSGYVPEGRDVKGSQAAKHDGEEITVQGILNAFNKKKDNETK